MLEKCDIIMALHTFKLYIHNSEMDYLDNIKSITKKTIVSKISNEIFKLHLHL